MSNFAISSERSPHPVSVHPLWLNICAWKVPAGFPSPAADHVQSRIDLNEHLIQNKEATFLFRVRGDSMMDIGIYEGDTLIVDRSIAPLHNHIVLAVLNNEFTVKRLYRRHGEIQLVAENPVYPRRVMTPEDDLTIWGVVTFNLRKLY